MNKKIMYFILTIITFYAFNNITYAKISVKDLFQAKDEIIVDKELDGTAFLAGNDIKLNKKINGISFIMGNNIKINSNQDYIFGFSTEITINNDIEKDLFLFSSIVNINSTLKRDAYIAGEEINIDGTVKRNLYIYGTDVNLKGNYEGNITINATNIHIDKDTKINGTLKYNNNALINNMDKNIKTKTYNPNENNISLKDYLTSFLSSYIHITLLGIVLMYLLEKIFIKSLKETEDLKVKTISILCGKGFLIFIGVPIIAIMLMFSGLFVSIGTIIAILYGIMIYISEIFTAYFIANILDKKLLKKELNGYILIIIGLFILYIFKLLPLIGGLISMISLLLGIGIIGNMIIESKK